MSTLKKQFEEYKSLKDQKKIYEFEQDVLKKFLHTISESSIKELQECYDISPDLYSMIMYSIVDNYEDVVMSMVEDMKLRLLLKSYTPVKRIENHTSVEQMVEKTAFIPTSELTTLENLFSFKGDDVDKLSQLLDKGIVLIDKSSRNNVTYQIDTLIDYEFIKSKDLMTNVSQGIDKKVIERTNTILTYKGENVNKTDVTFHGGELTIPSKPLPSNRVDTSSSQDYIVLEKIGDLYRTIKTPDCGSQRIVTPSLEVEAYNALLSDQVLSHIRYIEVDSADNFKLKSETYTLRDRLVDAMMVAVKEKVKTIDTSTQLFSTLRRSDFIRSLTSIIAINVMKEVEEEYEIELSYTLMYGLNFINQTFGNSFSGFLKEEKSRIYGVYDRFSDPKVVGENIEFIIKGILQKVLKQIIPEKKGITQALTVKYNLLKGTMGTN